MIANSGGPDSTCLLFLLHHLATSSGARDDTPKKILSLHVDHRLQLSSTEMSAACARNSLGIGLAPRDHSTACVQWGHSPLPRKPISGEPIEAVARDARYHLLMEGLMHRNTQVLATGHHADDQVETTFIRLSRGSQEEGAAGMRPIRRWGMGETGSRHEITWAGMSGINCYVIRPLLRFTKVMRLELSEGLYLTFASIIGQNITDMCSS